jgi:hypothetical protein
MFANVLVRMRALALAFVALLPVAAASSRVVLAMRGPESHVCVCPIGADGSCACLDCIRLHIHDPIDDHHREHDGDHEGDHEREAVVTSACESDEHLSPARAFDPAVVPLVLELAESPSVALGPVRELDREPVPHPADPLVPPPRAA